jgi:hypothetical protein
MSTEKYHKARSLGTSRESLCLMLRLDFSALRSTMRLTTLKTLIWIPILLFVATTLFFVASFVFRTILHEPRIDSPLMAKETQSTPADFCDPVVFAIPANGDVYFGKNVTGSLAKPLDVETTIREVIAARGSRLAYASGMDLGLEVPRPHCYDKPVYLKFTGVTNLKPLVRALQEAGAEVIIIEDRKKDQAPIS